MEKDKQFEENLWLFLSTGLTNLTNRVNQNYEIIKVNPAKGNQESRRLSFFQLNLIVFIFSYVSIELINYSKILATPLNNNVYFFYFVAVLIIAKLFSSFVLLISCFLYFLKVLTGSYKLYLLKGKRNIHKELISAHLYIPNSKDSMKVPKVKVKSIGHTLIIVKIAILNSDLFEKLETEELIERSLTILSNGYEVIGKQAIYDARYYLFVLSKPLKFDQLKINHLSDIQVDKHSFSIMRGLPWNFQDMAPNALICGSVGSGKTRACEYLLVGFSSILGFKSKENIFILDPKNDIKIRYYHSLVDRENYARTGNEALDLLKKVFAINEQRKNLLSSELSPILLYIDELASLKLLSFGTGSESDNKKGRNEIDRLLKILLTQGRSQKISVLASLQEPNVRNLPSELREQFQWRTVMMPSKRTGAETLKMVFGSYKDLSLPNYDKGEGKSMISGIRYDHPFDIAFPWQNKRSLDSAYKDLSDEDAPDLYYDLFKKALQNKGLYSGKSDSNKQAP